MPELYLWIKSLHLLSAMSWFASLFALAGLCLLHARSATQTDAHPFQAQIAEFGRLLLKRIVNPLMLIALLLGVITLALNPAWLKSGWMHAKLLLVIGLCGYHGVLAKTQRQLAEHQPVSLNKIRTLCWLPFLLMTGIAILVVVKPF